MRDHHWMTLKWITCLKTTRVSNDTSRIFLLARAGLSCNVYVQRCLGHFVICCSRNFSHVWSLPSIDHKALRALGTFGDAVGTWWGSAAVQYRQVSLASSKTGNHWKPITLNSTVCKPLAVSTTGSRMCFVSPDGHMQCQRQTKYKFWTCSNDSYAETLPARK